MTLVINVKENEMDDTKKLSEVRKLWEQHSTEILCAIHQEYEYRTVLVVLKNGDEYSMHRYFKVGEEWNMSIDECGKTSLEENLKKVTEYFKDIYPKE